MGPHLIAEHADAMDAFDGFRDAVEDPAVGRDEGDTVSAQGGRGPEESAGSDGAGREQSLA